MVDHHIGNVVAFICWYNTYLCISEVPVLLQRPCSCGKNKQSMTVCHVSRFLPPRVGLRGWLGRDLWQLWDDISFQLIWDDDPFLISQWGWTSRNHQPFISSGAISLTNRTLGATDNQIRHEYGPRRNHVTRARNHFIYLGMCAWTAIFHD